MEEQLKGTKESTTAEHAGVKGAVATAPKVSPKRGKKRREVRRGRVYIQATYNNTMVTVTDPQGNVLIWTSAGKVGFRGPKKATPFAATQAVRSLADRLREFGFSEAEVFLTGVGSGREAAVRSLQGVGVHVLSIKDITPIPHNGPRAPKVRRV